MSVLHATAVAVGDVLDAASLSMAFFTDVCYETELPLEELDELHVSIVPAGLTQEPSSRSSLAYNVIIDVAVRYRFGQADQVEATQQVDVARISEYVALLEEIAECLAANRTLDDVAWLRNEIRFPWVPQHLHEHRQYTGIVRATYFSEHE